MSYGSGKRKTCLEVRSHPCLFLFNFVSLCSMLASHLGNFAAYFSLSFFKLLLTLLLKPLLKLLLMPLFELLVRHLESLQPMEVEAGELGI